MIANLPKFVDRAFFIGFLLPALIFVVLNGVLVGNAVSTGWVTERLEEPTWADLALGVLIVWFLAVLLVVANRPLMRLMEAYGPLQHPKSPWIRYQRWRWDRLHAAGERSRTSGTAAERIRAHQRFATEFPDDQEWLLPTAFGNAVRAFEVYPRVLYGVDAIWAWPRLQAVIPDEFTKQSEDARAALDFWLSSWGLTLFLTGEALVLMVLTRDWWFGAWCVAGILAAWLCTRRARAHAIQWGEYVKAAFDLYLPALAEQTRLPGLTGTPDSWRTFSQAIGYRHARSIERLRNPTQPPTDTPDHDPGAPAEPIADSDTRAPTHHDEQDLQEAVSTTDEQAHYDAARSFATTFAGAGVGVLVAIMTLKIAALVDKGPRADGTVYWIWLLGIWALTFLCFFRLYWLHWNTVSYLRPFDSFRLFVNDVSAYICASLWIFFVDYPLIWPSIATLLFLLCVGRAHIVREKGPLAPRTRACEEWREFETTYDTNTTWYAACIIVFAAGAVLNLALLATGTTTQTIDARLLLAEVGIFVVVGVVANWPPRVACQFFPITRNTR